MSSEGAAEAFAVTLEETGTHLQCEDLVKLYPPLPPASGNKPIELEKCKYLDLFDADPAEARAAMKRKREEAEAEHGAAFVREILSSKTHHPLRQNRRFDFRLKPEEKERLVATGAIACERLMSWSFGDIYYNLYSDDLPVFVTSDSILHAWHRSYNAFVVDMEEKCLRPALSTILEGSLSKCEAMTTNANENQSEMGELKDGYENLGAQRSIVLQERTADVELFSTLRIVDFSLFKPRGHYTKSESLKNYFRAMMWLGIVDLRIHNLHQLLCGVILLHCLRESETLDDVQQFDSLLLSLVGSGADSMSMKDFTQFIPLESMAKLTNPSAFGDQERQSLLQELQQQIVESSSASQIPSGCDSVTEEQGDHIGGQVVHDGVKQPRDIPSAVDVAFTLFGNNEAAQELVARMKISPDADEFVFRHDGIPISSNLVALRKIIDEVFEESIATTASVSTLWLLALRALSSPSPNRSSTFHSGTWQRRQMNTQIASFTQLRHDTVLYAKQSSLLKPQCEYPDGMVDPYPEFWRRMREMALQMKDIEEDAQKLREFCSRSNFDEFASTMKTLEDIAVLQTPGKELNEDQETVMKSIIERRRMSGCAEYSGWYPSLFYGSKAHSCRRDVLVVDVHTNYIDPECVLHLGVGDPVLGFFIVNEVMYVGPLFSSYEFTTPLDQRLTDEEFKKKKLPWIDAPHWALQSFRCHRGYVESSEKDEP
ncbi:hypothetical protein V7S43_000758 [Phytophthora oleae]|uniref:Uncharacterized protein n=1 Tax=Phytophthora oleae TaxID=2107226 RepID=A0ABD3GAB1_9STRA